ncbi:MAG TPA: hypothetical protein VGG10_20405 [Rhizomicrobium sp.]|jgi:hypothetical protein
MLEFGIPVIAFLMLIAAVARMRRELYGTGMLFMVAGLGLLLHTGLDASQTTESGMSANWISPVICVMHAGHNC